MSARQVTVRVHPDDQPLVAQGAAEALGARGARLVADPSIARGGCLVESDIGVVDASIAARWKRAVAALGCEETWDAAE
jgi:flagellar assembly protein FliH